MSPQIVAHVEAINVQAAQANLSLADVSNFRIRVPSYDEQTAIATVLTDMDAEIAALDAKLAKARALKQGMMQTLLTGRIRQGDPITLHAVGRWTDGTYRHCVTLSYTYRGEWTLPEGASPQPDETSPSTR